MRIVVLGAGESGVGAALLAKQNRHDVFVSDRGGIAEKYKHELDAHGIAYESGQHTWERVLAADEVIKSPGIPDHVPLIQELLAQGKPVISEIEYAGRYHQSKVIGITGSNGKTTTTRLAWHLLKAAGFDVEMGGNIGKSFARCLTERHRQWYVLELSSFQLDGISAFRPDLGMLLNISPDHLDRYGYEMGRYVAAKFRINRSQRPDDWFVYKAEDAYIREYLQGYAPNGQPLGLTGGQVLERGVVAEGQFFDLSQTRLKGQHNYYNALFALTAALKCGAGAAALQQGLESFVPVPHRMEVVGTVKGVGYINDSKATNVDAAYYALDAMPGSTVWIAGGQDKGNDYAPLQPLAQEKVRVLICLGVDNEKLKTAFAGIAGLILEAGSAEEAVQLAAQHAREGEQVLLSPACASFDLFKNYEHRGGLFREAVLGLKKTE